MEVSQQFTVDHPAKPRRNASQASNRLTQLACDAWRRGFIALLAGSALLTGCGDDSTNVTTGDDGTVQLTVWIHQGKQAEFDVLSKQIKAYDDANDDVSINLIAIAEDGYSTRINSAASGNQLPDVLELDGPYTASYAWQNILQPIGPHVPQSLKDDLLPSITQQGTYDGKLWSIGQFDSGLSLYANRSMLEAAHIRVPTGVDDPWTIDEFNQALQTLASVERAADGDGQVLDLKRNNTGEWWTYAFYAPLQSAGGGMVDLSTTPAKAAGMLDSDASVKTVQSIAGWVTGGLVDPNSDENAFTDKRVALSWSGHWDYPRYKEALGDDLLILPLPNFGQGSKTGMGSWAMGISGSSRNADAAGQLIAYLMQSENVLEMTAANGAVPATVTAVSQSEAYKEGGPLTLFAQQLKTAAVARPTTPAYPVVTSAFQDVMNDALAGGDVKASLQKAAQTIDRDIEDQQGYPPPTSR